MWRPQNFTLGHPTDVTFNAPDDAGKGRPQDIGKTRLLVLHRQPHGEVFYGRPQDVLGTKVSLGKWVISHRRRITKSTCNRFLIDTINVILLVWR